MFDRIGSAAVALGLIVVGPGVLAQERIEPALESQPVPESREQTGAEQSQTGASQQQTDADRLVPAIEAIGTAIRNLIAEEDAIERERQEQREIADLRAQKDMALWAKAMFWASFAAVVLTSIGIFLIWRTLLYTSRAVEEAERGTKAAIDSVTITRDLGIRQIRAYMASDPHIQWQKAYVGSPDNVVGYNFTITWKNYGQTPAYRCHGRMSFGAFDQRIPADFDYPDKAVPQITETNHVGPGQFFMHRVGGLSISDGEAIERGQKFAYVWGWMEYNDIFRRARRRTEICFELQLRDGGKTLVPTVYGPFNSADEDCYHKPKT